MFKTFINAFKVKDIRKKLTFTFLCLIVIRLGCQIVSPGIGEGAKQFFNADNLGFLSMLTGGSLQRMSIFALNVSPYITASIIMQLMTIAIPRLAEMQKEGETGRKKIAEISRYLTVVLALIEGGAMAIGFHNSGYLENDKWITVVIVVAAFTAGSAFLMWLGENITERGVGNGISIILLINIVSEMPSTFVALYKQFVENKAFGKALLAVVVIVGALLATLVLIVLLQDAERKIAVQYSKKMQGRRMVGGNSSFIPLKVNTAGVIPVIFAVSIFQFPVVIAGFFGVSSNNPNGSVGEKILYACNSQHWFDISSGKMFAYSIGALVYVAMILFFAYFYTSITFNPIEVSNNMKKDGGFIPGIRPGKPTTDYLVRVLNYIVLIGAVGLAIVALIPIIFGGVFNAQLSFGGTSLIIVVGVVLETMKQIESQLLVRHYKGFLND